MILHSSALTITPRRHPSLYLSSTFLTVTVYITKGKRGSVYLEDLYLCILFLRGLKSLIMVHSERNLCRLFIRFSLSRSRRYPATTITDADYADDIAILTNTPDQAETLLHSLERAAASIGLDVNAHKTEYMCYNQTGDISLYKEPHLN